MRALVLSWGMGKEQPSASDSERKAPVRRNVSTRRVASPLRERWSRGANPLRAPAIAMEARQGGDACGSVHDSAAIAQGEPQ